MVVADPRTYAVRAMGTIIPAKNAINTAWEHVSKIAGMISKDLKNESATFFRIFSPVKQCQYTCGKSESDFLKAMNKRRIFHHACI